MITITLTGEEAEEYIAFKTAKKEPSKDVSDEIMPLSAFKAPLVARSPQPPIIETKVDLPISTVKTTTAHLTRQAAIQDELEASKSPSFPTPPSISKPIPANPLEKPVKKKPFSWKPYMPSLKNIMRLKPRERTLQRVINVLQPKVVATTVLRDKLMREGITYDLNTGLLYWRDDGFNHAKKGIRYE